VRAGGTLVAARGDKGRRAAIGQSLALTADAQRCFLFDAAGGARLRL
jgi:hypothetical protein